MFATPDDFAQYHLNLGETCDYDAMRNNIAVAHFHGNTAFAHSDFGGAPHETIGASVTYPETHAHHHGGDGGQ
jgi:hypothetical protein